LEEKMADTDNTEIVGQASPEAPQQDPALSLEELSMLMQIVDLAVQRGAFRGGEASQVGAVYDKLNAFLGAVAQAQQADAEADGGAPEEGEAPAEAPVEGE
tara:strand:+ start:249 stop:551 length:303 start_codon:yes stop_codon:yes gene_type:complete